MTPDALEVSAQNKSRASEPYETSPWTSLVADLNANKGKPREMLIVVLLRLCQSIHRQAPLLAIPFILIYRIVVEVGFNLELRPETKVGPGLKLFHCTGIVIETGCVLGANVTLHQNVTIGRKTSSSGVPRIGSDVFIGAGAIIVGNIEVGDGALIGAGCVVTTDVPARHIVKPALTRIEAIQ